MINKIFKNRTYLGIFSIILALIISFGITPFINKKTGSQTEIIRVNKDIKEGEEITPDKITKIKVGAYNLPSGVVTNPDEVVSKFAKSDMYKGDFIFKEKVNNIASMKDYYLNNSFNDKIAISATIRTSASGLSGKLREGDIVTVIAQETEDGKPVLIKELQYVKVLSTTTNEGIDKEDSEDMPNTITFSVNDIQAEKIAQLEIQGGIHVALVYRGEDEDTVQAYLDVQNEYFEFLEENNLIDGIYELESEGYLEEYGYDDELMYEGLNE